MTSREVARVDSDGAYPEVEAVWVEAAEEATDPWGRPEVVVWGGGGRTLITGRGGAVVRPAAARTSGVGFSSRCAVTSGWPEVG